jgi:hypothetical protein
MQNANNVVTAVSRLTYLVAEMLLLGLFVRSTLVGQLLMSKNKTPMVVCINRA